MKPITKTTRVPLNCQDAFDLFIRHLDDWWPKDSHSAFGPESTLSVAPHKDGEIVETAQDGTRYLWGHIIAWEPGSYLAYTWYPNTPDAAATVVAIAFIETEEGTRLDLTHGGLKILGETADAISTSYLFGWDLVLGSYYFAASSCKVLA